MDAVNRQAAILNRLTSRAIPETKEVVWAEKGGNGTPRNLSGHILASLPSPPTLVPMTSYRFLLTTLAAITPIPLSAHETLPPGIWTNTEDAYFAEEEGREKPEWVGYEVSEDGKWRSIDAFRKAQSDWNRGRIPGLSERGESGWQVDNSELRKARDFFCWVSVRRFANKADGSPDWSFVRNLPIFDQGGRALVPGEGTAPDVTIRMRNVTWARGSRNKPSLVLYIHKEDPVRAESYSWASPDSRMVGVNLRWAQASCSRALSQAEAP